MLVIVSTLWALEGVPLYITSLMIPVIVVWFKILPSDDGITPLPASQAASVISEQFWSPTIFLFLGGFTIAAALEKYGLNRALVNSIILSFRILINQLKRQLLSFQEFQQNHG